MKSKTERHFEKIADIKKHIEELSTEDIEIRLTAGALTKEGAIAHRELLKERKSEKSLTPQD